MAACVCCTAPACYRRGGRRLCLSHFHAGLGAAEDEDCPKRGVVISSSECAARFTGLQALWSQVNRELAQELAEGSIEQRSDQLAFLSIGGGGGNSGGAPASKNKQRASAAALPIRRAPKKKPAAQDVAPAPPQLADTTKRRKTRPMMMATTKAGVSAAAGAGRTDAEDATASATASIASAGSSSLGSLDSLDSQRWREGGA